MKTTMAPMDQVRQNSPEELPRRHKLIQEVPVRRIDDRQAAGGSRRDGGFGGGFGNGPNSNGNGNGGSSWGGSSNGKGYGGGGGGDNSSSGQDNSGANKPENPQKNQPTQQPSSTAVTKISTTAAPAPAALTTSATSTTDTDTLISSIFSKTTSFVPNPVITVPLSAETSSQYRKGLNRDGDPYESSSASTTKAPKSMSTTTATQAVMPQTALASGPTALSIPGSGSSGHHKKADGLSSLAEQLLVAAGAMGAFIIIAALVYFLTRMMKIDVLSKLRSRKVSRGGSCGWYGSRRKSENYASDPPPVYPGEGFFSDEKSIPAQRELDAFFSPMARPPLATPAGAAALSSIDPQRQETVRAALLDNPTPIGASPEARRGSLSATRNFYNISPQNANIPRQPDTQVSQNSQVSAISQHISTNSRLPVVQTSFPSRENSNYNHTGTQNTFLTMQTSEAYDPKQREVNHLSYLSSLSSGFGDGLTIPDSSVSGVPQQGYRQSRTQGAARFSWVTSVRDRDSVYTQASVETAPRFRTVNSWVAQQSSRVESQQQTDAEAPAMPALPLSLQAGVDHDRNASEDPAFRAHPGDEISISKGSRVPSEILDNTIWFR